MTGRFVVGIDDSRPARAAWRWARIRAEEGGVACVAVHVREADADEPLPDAVIPGPGEAAAVVVRGPVPQALAGFVGGADVLVLGTGKTGFVHGRVYGSRGIQIVALARSTVAVIPDVDIRFRSGVVAGIDRHETAGPVAAAAATEAAWRREPLQLLQSRPPDGRPAADELDLAVAAAELAVRDGWPGLDVRTRVVARPAAEALLDAARSATLLVLGPGAPRTTDGGRTPGRVLHDVLVNANAPVLAVRPEDAVLPG